MSFSIHLLDNHWNPPALHPSSLLARLMTEGRSIHRHVSLLGLTAFLSLSLADLVLTRILLQQSGGAIYEANPLADVIIQQCGWSALTIFKLGMVGLISAIVIYVAYYQPKTAQRLLLFACTLMTGVVGYSSCLVVLFV